jgi:A/G-specific adenine glycosylase
MKKEKKVSRSEDEVVCVTEWVYNDKRSWLFVKRPEKGEFIVGPLSLG